MPLPTKVINPKHIPVEAAEEPLQRLERHRDGDSYGIPILLAYVASAEETGLGECRLQ